MNGRSVVGVVRAVTGCLAAAIAGACGSADSTGNEREEFLEAVPVAQSGPDVEFGGITDIAVGSGAEIYVGDLYSRVFTFRSDGTLVRTFGELGHGPGEFEAVTTLHVAGGDSLYVYDGYAQRATVYAPNSGRVAYTFRLPEPDYSYPMDVEPYGAGTLIGHFRRINGDVPIAGQRRDDVIRLLARDGSMVRDTLLTVREPDIAEVRTDQSHGFFHPEFARQTLVRWGPGNRIYSLWTDSSTIHVHDTEGRSRGSYDLALSTPRIPLAASTIDSTAQANAVSGFTRRQLEQAFRARWQTWPLVDDMLVDDRSRIWIRPVTHAPSVNWIAFDERGRRLARFTIPRTVRPRLIKDDRVYAVSRDSLDVETLAVFRLTPASTRTLADP